MKTVAETSSKLVFGFIVVENLQRNAKEYEQCQEIRRQVSLNFIGGESTASRKLNSTSTFVRL